MATYSAGITATWGGVAFAEITDLSWTWGGAAPKGRSVIWTDEVGSVSITTLNLTNMTTAEYGERKQLLLGGGGQLLEAYAVFEGLTVAPELNGVTKYTATFKLLD